MVFGLTRPGLEPTIYRTQGEHANHYTTDVVRWILICLIVVQENKTTSTCYGICQQGIF
jgi:hypothetical protein